MIPAWCARPSACAKSATHAQARGQGTGDSASNCCNVRPTRGAKTQGAQYLVAIFLHSWITTAFGSLTPALGVHLRGKQSLREWDVRSGCPRDLSTTPKGLRSLL